MIIVAVVSKGVVLNVVSFADEDRDLIKDFNFPEADDAIGIPLDEGQNVSAGYLYEDGKFVAPEPPEPTKEELIRQAENQKQFLISTANQVFVSWQTKLLLNRATEDEKKSLNEWFDYFEALKILDISKAPDVQWPEQPAIPEGGQ